MVVRFARVYSDGSVNVSSEGEDYARALKLMVDSSDDDDTQLVQVEFRVIGNFGSPKIKLVASKDAVRDALEQAYDCIKGETPEDCTDEEARDDTLEKIHVALRSLDTLS